MMIQPQVVLTLDHAEYAQFALVIGYMLDEDAVMTAEMHAFAVNTAIKLGLKMPDNDDPDEEDRSTEPKLH